MFNDFFQNWRITLSNFELTAYAVIHFLVIYALVVLGKSDLIVALILAAIYIPLYGQHVRKRFFKIKEQYEQKNDT